ncbi:polysaccharide biosynthesis tyrosine autokinase [candidate division KSB1 bacterium]|nr:polysaccharide biosynthesis tyrosine autokinase [candidate division KSB1 bacterium]RQW01174.1 MAG: polysaccharide biosynthesis tyrosine autokinase [candidate division KSB1 bacterium]
MDNIDLFKEMELEGFRLQNNQKLSTVLIDYIKIMFRRKWLIALCTIAVVVPITIWIMHVPPSYRADATIIYEEANDTAFLLDLGQTFYSKSAIVNMIEQIQSRTLAEEVVRSLPEDMIKTFKLPERLPEHLSRDQFIVRLIREELQVEHVRGGDILKIIVQANDPNAAKNIANSYVDHIIDWNTQKNRKEISSIRNFVEGQLSVFQDKLRDAEEALVTFKENNDVIQLSDASSKVLENLTEAEVAYSKARAEREALQQRKHIIEQKKQELLPSLGVPVSKITQQLKEELLDLERQYSRLQLQVGLDDQEKLASMREKINQTKQDLIDELMHNAAQENLVDPLSQIRNLLQEAITIDVDLETCKAQEQALKNAVDEHDAELQMLPQQELELARLIRAKEVNDKIYGTLLEKREEARITESGKIGDIRVIDYAELPIKPVKPQKKKIFVLALMLGLSLGVGLAFFLNSLDNSLKSEQDVEKCLNLPVLASIPNISSNGVLRKITKKEDADNLYSSKLLSQLLAKSYIFEAYRSLQLNFSLLNPDKNLKTVVITSAAPGEGKTLTSLNIAQLYARAGIRTLVMDCDLRRPMVHKALKIRQEPGLTNALIDKAAHLESYVQLFNDESLHDNLAVLTCGALPPNPSEILGSKRMGDLLAQLEDMYGLIIIDAPPIISVTDSIILGQKVDGVLLVLRSGKITREAAQKAKKILENSKIHIAGTLLNDVDLKKVYGYYKDYYYYSNKKMAVES